ncbi:MAG: PadR family transcriptional regulator [Bacillota bacterium]|nr:PadR family transcriptional regulator [Bacillota bacterium]
MELEDWKTQIKRGTLEYAILLLISKGDSYGYQIIATLEKYPSLFAKENTVYPLLRRLLKEGYIDSFWREGNEGLPPRKYYAITQKGKEAIAYMSKEWDNLLNDLGNIKGE